MPKGDKARRGGARGHVANAGPSRNELNNYDGLSSLKDSGVHLFAARVVGIHSKASGIVSVNTAGYGSGTAKILANKRLKQYFAGVLARDPNALVIVCKIERLGKSGNSFEIVAVNPFTPDYMDEKREPCPEILALVCSVDHIPPRPDGEGDQGIKFLTEEEQAELAAREEEGEEEVNLDDL